MGDPVSLDSTSTQEHRLLKLTLKYSGPDGELVSKSQKLCSCTESRLPDCLYPIDGKKNEFLVLLSGEDIDSMIHSVKSHLRKRRDPACPNISKRKRKPSKKARKKRAAPNLSTVLSEFHIECQMTKVPNHRITRLLKTYVGYCATAESQEESKNTEAYLSQLTNMIKMGQVPIETLAQTHGIGSVVAAMTLEDRVSLLHKVKDRTLPERWPILKSLCQKKYSVKCAHLQVGTDPLAITLGQDDELKDHYLQVRGTKGEGPLYLQIPDPLSYTRVFGSRDWVVQTTGRANVTISEIKTLFSCIMWKHHPTVQLQHLSVDRSMLILLDLYRQGMLKQEGVKLLLKRLVLFFFFC